MNRRNLISTNKTSFNAKTLSIKNQKEKNLVESRFNNRNLLVANRKMKRDEKMDEKRCLPSTPLRSSNNTPSAKIHEDVTMTKDELRQRLEQYRKEKEEKKNETKLALSKRPPFRAGAVTDKFKSKIPMKVDNGFKFYEDTLSKIAKTSRPTSSVKSKSSAKRDGNETVVISANNSLISNTSIRKSETINCNESFVKSIENSSNSPSVDKCAEMSVKNDEDGEFKSEKTTATSVNHGTDIDEIEFQISSENFTPLSDEKHNSHRKRRQTMTPGELDVQLTKPPEICFDLPFDTPGSILKSVHTSVRKSVRFNLLAKKRDSFSSFLSADDTPSPLQVDEKSLDFENAGCTPKIQMFSPDFEMTPLESEAKSTGHRENIRELTPEKKSTPLRRSTRRKSAINKMPVDSQPNVNHGEASGQQESSQKSSADQIKKPLYQESTEHSLTNINVVEPVIAQESAKKLISDEKKTPLRRSSRHYSNADRSIIETKTNILSPFLRTRRSVYPAKENLIEF